MEELEANEEIKTINKWDDYDLKVDLLRGICLLIVPLIFQI